MSADEKLTVEIEKPPVWAIAMAENQAKGFESVNGRLDGIERTVDTLVEDKQVSNLRMARIEKRMDTFEERADQTSMRIKEPSQHDLETSKALADEIVARTALAAKVDAIAAETSAQTAMLTEAKAAAKKFFANPLVRMILTMAGTAVAAWLAAHGGVK